MPAGLKPIYLLAGGRSRTRETPDPLLAAVFRECGHSAPSIAYVGAANEDNPGFFQRMSGFLRQSGVGDVCLAPVSDFPQAKGVLAAADLVFVSGGDVERGMRLLQKNRLIPVLRRLHEDGVPFFGLSAGSIMLARQWVRWADPDDDATAEAFPCLGLAPVLCDTHGEDEDWEELQALLKLVEDGAIGYGIPSGAALRVAPDGEAIALDAAVHRFVRRGGNVHRLPDLPPDDARRNER